MALAPYFAVMAPVSASNGTSAANHGANCNASGREVHHQGDLRVRPHP